MCLWPVVWLKKVRKSIFLNGTETQIKKFIMLELLKFFEFGSRISCKISCIIRHVLDVFIWKSKVNPDNYVCVYVCRKIIESLRIRLNLVHIFNFSHRDTEGMLRSWYVIDSVLSDNESKKLCRQVLKLLFYFTNKFSKEKRSCLKWSSEVIGPMRGFLCKVKRYFSGTIYFDSYYLWTYVT